MLPDWRKLLKGDIPGILVTYQTIKDVMALPHKLRYSVSDTRSVLTLAEQLRFVKVGMAVSQPVHTEKEKRPYSDDLAPLAHKIKVELKIRMAPKSATAGPYSPEEVPVLRAVYPIAIFQEYIIDFFLLISKRTEQAQTDRVHKIMKQIEVSKKSQTS